MSVEDINQQGDELIMQAKKINTIAEKLSDAMEPGYQVDFDPDEAELMGAFEEDAISEQEAMESND